jgi:hypothetical protein
MAEKETRPNVTKIDESPNDFAMTPESPKRNMAI